MLIDLKVGIGVSIDGFTEEENSMRIDRDGNTVFKKIFLVPDKINVIGLESAVKVGCDKVNAFLPLLLIELHLVEIRNNKSHRQRNKRETNKHLRKFDCQRIFFHP